MSTGIISVSGRVWTANQYTCYELGWPTLEARNECLRVDISPPERSQVFNISLRLWPYLLV